MNESSQLSQGGISKGVQSFVLWVTIIGLMCMIGGYAYYIYVIKNEEISAYIELERIRADEEYNKLVESMPKANPNDELGSKDIESILKGNTSASLEGTLTTEEADQIIRNNTEAR